MIDVPGAQPITGDPMSCLGQSTYSAPANVFNSFNWTISGGGAVFPIGNTAIVNWAVVGNFDINVVPSNQCGTGPMTTLPITVKAILFLITHN